MLPNWNLNKNLKSNERKKATTSQQIKVRDQMAFTGEFYQIFQEELSSNILKLLQNVQIERTLLNSFYKSSITLIQKPDKDTKRKENYSPVCPMNIDEKSSRKYCTLNSRLH